LKLNSTIPSINLFVNNDDTFTFDGKLNGSIIAPFTDLEDALI